MTIICLDISLPSRYGIIKISFVLNSFGDIYTLVATSTACEEIDACLHSLNKTLQAK